MQGEREAIESYLREGSQIRLAAIDLWDEYLRASDAISKAFPGRVHSIRSSRPGASASPRYWTA